MPNPRYAPAREDGTKPYVVKVKCTRPMCNDIAERLVWAWTPTGARDDAIGREQHTKAIACRRATPEDVTNLKEYR